MNYPKTSKTNTSLDAHERLIVNAVKGAYDERLKTTDSYKIALRLIEEVVYGNRAGETPQWIFFNFIRTLLLKTRNWTLADWESQTQYRFYNAFHSAKIWKVDFFEDYLNRHLADVQGLRINAGSEQDGYVNILDLDLDVEFEEKALSKLDNSK